MSIAMACTSFSEDTRGEPTTDASLEDAGDATKQDVEVDGSGSTTEGGLSPACVNDVVLVGNDDITERNNDNVALKVVDAYPYKVAGSPSIVSLAGCIRIYLGESPAPQPGSVVHVGVYGDDSANPKTLLAAAKIDNPKTGWNAAKLDKAVPVESGQILWLAAIPEVADVSLLVTHNCAANVRRQDKSGATGLPQTFTAEMPEMTHCDAAFYLSP